MKKFLSILLLVCLLWGLALPAAAEGEAPGKLYAKQHEGTWTDSLTITQNVPTKVWFSTEGTEAPVVITGTISPSSANVTIEGPDSADDNSYTVTAAAASEEPCVLSYSDGTAAYSISVTVIPASASPVTSLVIPADNLGILAGTNEDFIGYLKHNGYTGTGDFTIILPAEDLGSFACNVQLPDDAILTLKGAEGLKTNVTEGLTISAANVLLDGIKFTGAESVTVDPGCNLAVLNCAFKGSDYAFRLKQDSDGKVALLNLTNNSFDTIKMAAILGSDGTTEIGWWRAEQGSDSSSAEIDFGVTVEKIETSDKIESLNIDVLSSKAALMNKGWSISFLTNCGFSDSYVVYGNKKAASFLDTGKKQITIGGQYKGEYIVVNDSYPKLVDKKGYYELPISANHEKYLKEVTLDAFPYMAASVTLNGRTVDISMKYASGASSLTITDIEEGTYVIRETTKTVATTKTVTKTVTKPTSRSYKYTYQDYYLVTPAGFANGMRYVKDNLVTLDCSQAAKKPISLPVASMAEAAEKGYSLLVKTKDAELTLDAAALKSLAQQARGTTVLLRYQSLNHKTLTTVGQASLKSHLSQFPGDSADLAFLVTATSDSETIEDLQKGTVTLKIPFIVLPGTEEMENRVYALQSESLSEARETAVADGCLTTTLLDLTEHMVFQVGEPVETTGETTEATVETTVETTEETTQPETEPETTAPAEPVETAKKGGGLIIGFSVVLVILCGVVGFVFLRKRFRK